jgi:hypothetical protein
MSVFDVRGGSVRVHIWAIIAAAITTSWALV